MNTPLATSGFAVRARTVLARFGYAVMAPIAKIFMYFGWSARDFGDLARWVYVKVYYQSPQFWRNGRPSAVEAAIKTGLPRTVVKQLNAIPMPEQAMLSYHQNLAYRVIEGWVVDPFFHVDGGPTQLPMSNPGEGPSFRKLVAKYGTHVTYQQAVADLINSGCVKYERGVVTLVDQTYGRNLLNENLLGIVGYAIRRLGETVAHNISHSDIEQRRLQRLWFSTRIPEEHQAVALERLKNESAASGRRMDAIMAEYSSETRQANVKYVEIGVGVYLYVDDDSQEPETLLENTEKE